MSQDVSSQQVNVQGVVVYVIDDDDDLRASLCWLLEGVGMNVRTFPDARTFLDAYEESTPACVIADVRMPHISGLQLQERLNERESSAQLIFCSAHGDIPMSVQTIQRGAITFLEKPYEPQRMIDIVQQGLSAAAESFSRKANRRGILGKLAVLTDREREVLRLVVEGMPSQNIARKLGTSVKTVDVHRGHIKTKTRTESIPVLVRDILQSDVDV